MKINALALILGILIFCFTAFAVYSSSAVKYHGVTAPSNIVGFNSKYAVGTYTNHIVCPPGDFVKNAQYPNNFCNEKDSGATISSWEIVTFGANIQNAKSVQLRTGNYNDGCAGSGCGKTTSSKIFITSNYNANPNWTFITAANINYNTTITLTGNLANGTTVSAVLVARGGDGSERPDPRWYWVNVTQ